MNPNHRRCSFKRLFNSGPDRQAVLNVKPLCQSRIACSAWLYYISHVCRWQMPDLLYMQLTLKHAVLQHAKRFPMPALLST